MVGRDPVPRHESRYCGGCPHICAPGFRGRRKRRILRPKVNGGFPHGYLTMKSLFAVKQGAQDAFEGM